VTTGRSGTVGSVSTATKEALHGAAERRLAKVGQRHTRQRRAILDLVVAAGAPVSVPDLLSREGADVSQSSLYRNLVVLEEVGVLQRVAGFGNHDRFELSEALSGHHHHHLQCTGCGVVIDVPTDSGFEQAMADEAEKASRGLGFRVTGHSVDLFGLCRKCG
jgi:Fe2+ or Zn2+ uptake regulation protein